MPVPSRIGLECSSTLYVWRGMGQRGRDRRDSLNPQFPHHLMHHQIQSPRRRPSRATLRAAPLHTSGGSGLDPTVPLIALHDSSQ